MGRNAQPQRTETQVADHRAEIARRYLRGESQSAIGASLNISQPTVSNDLKAIRKAWLESAMQDWDAHRAEQLAKVDALEAMYLAAWERSCGEFTEHTRHIKTGNQGEPSLDRTEVKTVEKEGNPEFLRGIERCIERRCSILGLDAPKKTVSAIVGSVGVGHDNSLVAQHLLANPDAKLLADTLLRQLAGEE